MSGLTTFILHVADADTERLFPTLPWGEMWSERVSGDEADIKARFQLCLDAQIASAGEFSCTLDLKVGLWCRQAEHLEALRDRAGQVVVFSPAPLTILEALRRGRQTLVMAAAVAAGQVLGPDDIAVQAAGQGVGADLAPNLLGRRAAYDLVAGEALDFGKIL